MKKMVGVWFMDKLERERKKKQLKKYEKLGAVKFQKVVFQLEKWKYRFLKRIFPNSIAFLDKCCDYHKKKALRKAKTKEEQQRIIETCKFTKMAIRQEWNQEKNRNYHIDPKKPTEIYPYLEWNKKVHKGGLIKNMALISLLTGIIVLGYPIAIPFLLLEMISAGINFECVNIQNYSITRYQLVEDHLKLQEERRQREAIKNYGEASSVIHKCIAEKEELPSMSEIIGRIQTKEQLRELRELIIREQADRNIEIDRGNQKCNQLQQLQQK